VVNKLKSILGPRPSDNRAVLKKKNTARITRLAIDPVATLVFFIKPAIFLIDPSAGRLNTSLNNSYTTHSSAGLKKCLFSNDSSFFSSRSLLHFLSVLLLFRYVISAPLSDHVSQPHFSDVMVTSVTSLLYLTDGQLEVIWYCLSLDKREDQRDIPSPLKTWLMYLPTNITNTPRKSDWMPSWNTSRCASTVGLCRQAGAATPWYVAFMALFVSRA